MSPATSLTCVPKAKARPGTTRFPVKKIHTNKFAGVSYDWSIIEIKLKNRIAYSL